VKNHHYGSANMVAKNKKEKRKKEKKKITYEFVCNQSIIRIRSHDLVKKDHDVVELSKR